jgi:hypothetical protein
MSRWHDRSLDGIARWANLSPEERVADRVADILTAAEDIRTMIGGLRSDRLLALEIESAIEAIDETASSVMVLLPQPGAGPQRDPAVQSVLEDIDVWLQAESAKPESEERDIRFALQAFAAPYAPLLYFEIRRLEYLLGVLRPPARPSGGRH